MSHVTCIEHIGSYMLEVAVELLIELLLFIVVQRTSIS